MAAHRVAIWSEMEHPVFSTKVPASRTANATLGQSTMRRVFLGLLFFSLTACRGAFGGEALAPSSDSGGLLEKPSPAGQLHPSKSSKRVSRARPDADSRPQSLPLSSAATYASEHPTTLPMSSPAQPAPSASRTWTDRLLCRSGSRRGSSITPRSARADEPPGMRATLPRTLTKRCRLP